MTYLHATPVTNSDMPGTKCLSRRDYQDVLFINCIMCIKNIDLSPTQKIDRGALCPTLFYTLRPI